MNASCRAFVTLLAISLVGPLSAESPQTGLRDPEKEQRLREALDAAEKTAQEAPSSAHFLAEAEADTHLADFLNTPVIIKFDHTPSEEESAQFLKRSEDISTPKLRAEEQRLYRRALEIYDKVCGPDSTNEQRQNHLQAIENLEGRMHSAGNFAESEPFLKRSVEMMERHPELSKAPDKTLAGQRCDWAWTLRRLKKPDEAELQFRKTIEEDRQDPVPTEQKRLHLIMAREMLDSVGKHDDALQYAVEALGIDENDWKIDLLKTSGISGIAAIHDLQILASKFSERHRYDLAECLQLRALAFLIKRGPSYPEQTVAYEAFLLMKTDRLEASTQMARHFVQLSETQHGAASLATTLSLHVLAQGLFLAGHAQASKLVFERAMCIEAHGAQGKMKPNPAAAAQQREHYTALLKKEFGFTDERIQASIAAAEAVPLPTEKITPQLEKMLGPIRPLPELLDELNKEDKASGKPAVQTWSLDQPIAPELKRLVAAEVKR